jgi:diguanylate cyclase (GGDEF)-like protein
MSRTIETLVPSLGDDAVVVASFQRGAYFAPVAERYRRFAATGAAVVAGYAGPGPRPEGVEVVDLHPEEPLAERWVLVVLTPGASAALVAVDLEQLDPGEHELELGRTFDATWGFDRLAAAEQARRLAHDLGSRLHPATVARIHAAADRADAAPLGITEMTLAASLGAVSEHLDELHRRLDALRRGRDGELPAPDHLTGFGTRAHLHAWLGGDRVRDLPVPPVGVALVDLDGFARINDTIGHLNGDRVLAAAADAVRSQLRAGDLALRWGADEFLVLVPGVDPAGVEAVGRRLLDAIADVQTHGVRLSASAAVTVARQRPLPVEALQRELAAGAALGPGQLRRIGPDPDDPGAAPGPVGGSRTRRPDDRPDHVEGPGTRAGERPRDRRRPTDLTAGG